MQRDSGSNKPLWRGFIGCVVAYALIINALLSGVLGAEWAAQAAAGLVGEHCVTDARAALPDPAPAGQPDDSSHCAFCTLTAAAGVLPAALSSASFIQYRAGAPVSANDQDRSHLPDYPSKLPRGPPQRY